MKTKEIAHQLVVLCRAGKNLEAVETLLSPDVVSVEATGNETMPAVVSGKDAVRGKNEWWVANHTIHSSAIKGPFPNGDRFSVIYDFVVSPKNGPMAGKKVRMEEVALYTVSDGKIVREEFFYDMSGGGGEMVEERPAKKKAKKQVKKKAAPRTMNRAVAKTKAKTRPGTRAKGAKPKAAGKKGKNRRR